MDNWLRIYAWFLLIVTALPAFARLARPRELAQIMRLRYQNPKRRTRTRIGGIVYLGLALVATPFLLRSPVPQQRWLVLALLVGAVSAVEYILNSSVSTEDALTRRNRYFGGVYAFMAMTVAVLLLIR